jgi:hypothetical protein
MAESLNQPIVYDFCRANSQLRPISISSGASIFLKAALSQVFKKILVAYDLVLGINIQ